MSARLPASVLFIRKPRSPPYVLEVNEVINIDDHYPIFILVFGW